MKKLFFIILFLAMTNVIAQTTSLKVYLEVHRSQNQEYNFISGKRELTWDLPTKRNIRKDLQKRMKKERFVFEIITKESAAIYTVEMYGEGWAIIDQRGRIVYEKDAAAYFSNTIKDIVRALKALTR